MAAESNVLTINSGSSSIKFSLYVMGEAERLALRGELGGIGVRQGFLQAEDREGNQLTARELDLPDHEAALRILFHWLQGHEVGKDLHAVGHRMVHGGREHVKPQPVSLGVIEDLKLLMPLAPDHLPHEIKGLEAVRWHFPDLPQVVCCDTAFHRRRPEVAQRYAMPESLVREGLQRYGFHGLSYEYVTQELFKETGAPGVCGKLIIAHLGNGASMAAIEGGTCLDTTMGLTPAGANQLINHQAGLLGISGINADMHDLLALEDSQAEAALAVEIFCYQARKFVGALAAALGGLDTFVFTGGIGEISAPVRDRIRAPLGFLGIRLDRGLNEGNSPVISRHDSAVIVRVMKTNEELMIARHTRDILMESQGGDKGLKYAGIWWKKM